MILRKIGKILRGKATPFHIIAATTLAALYAFTPGWPQSPLLAILLPLLIIIINANLVVFGLSFLLFQLVHWLIIPLQFQIGIILVDGPLQSLWALLANAPVFAWLGVEYYLVPAGLLLGLLFGLLLGVLLSGQLQRFRRHMAHLERDSGKFQKLMARRWVRILGWILIGGTKAKGDWMKLTEKRIGNPLRPLGLVFAAGLAVLIAIGMMLLDSAIVGNLVRENLTRANGATVDLEGFDLSLRDGSLNIGAFAAADPEDLERNRFSSANVGVSFQAADFLRRRVVVDEVAVSTPRSGTQRTLPGQRVSRPAADSTGTSPDDAEDDSSWSILDMVEDTAVWRGRLETAYRLYQQWGPLLASDTGDADEPVSWRQRLMERARATGYAAVSSPDVVRGHPRIWVRNFEALDFQNVGESSQRWNITGKNLASEPARLPEEGGVDIRSVDGLWDLGVSWHPDQGAVETRVRLIRENWPVEELRQLLNNPQGFPIESGWIDIRADGPANLESLNLPVRVIVRDARIRTLGQDLNVSRIEVPAKIKGRLDRPRLHVDSSDWMDALRGAAGNQLREEIQQRSVDEIRRRLPFGG